MATEDENLQIWKLKLNTKTVSAAFQLNNKEAKRELNVNPRQQNPALLLQNPIPRGNFG